MENLQEEILERFLEQLEGNALFQSVDRAGLRSLLAAKTKPKAEQVIAILSAAPGTRDAAFE